MSSLYDTIAQQLADAGLELKGEPRISGKVERCRHEADRKGKSNGWYVLHEVVTKSGKTGIVGACGTWKDSSNHIKVSTFDKSILSDAERMELRDTLKKQQEQQERERIALQQKAAEKARTIWAKLPEGGVSDYLNKKRVRPFGVRFSKRGTVVPIVNGNGDLVNLQFIYPDGTKRFLTGGEKKACFHVVGAAIDGQPVFIAEGYATAATVHMAINRPVVVAFDAGNLLPVAKVMRSKFPNSKIYVAGDDDVDTDGNPGRTKAEEAANAVGGVAIFPNFTVAA